MTKVHRRVRFGWICGQTRPDALVWAASIGLICAILCNCIWVLFARCRQAPKVAQPIHTIAEFERHFPGNPDVKPVDGSELALVSRFGSEIGISRKYTTNLRPDGGTVFIETWRLGLPFRCLQYEEMGTGPGQVAMTVWNDGMDPPDFLRSESMPDRFVFRLVPGRPIPKTVIVLPFILNVLAWSLTGILIFVLTRAARGFWRVKRGRCPNCAYPISESTRCPECGISRDTSTPPQAAPI